MIDTVRFPFQSIYEADAPLAWARSHLEDGDYHVRADSRGIAFQRLAFEAGRYVQVGPARHWP